MAHKGLGAHGFKRMSVTTKGRQNAKQIDGHPKGISNSSFGKTNSEHVKAINFNCQDASFGAWSWRTR